MYASSSPLKMRHLPSSGVRKWHLVCSEKRGGKRYPSRLQPAGLRGAGAPPRPPGPAAPGSGLRGPLGARRARPGCAGSGRHRARADSAVRGRAGRGGAEEEGGGQAGCRASSRVWKLFLQGSPVPLKAALGTDRSPHIHTNTQS